MGNSSRELAADGPGTGGDADAEAQAPLLLHQAACNKRSPSPDRMVIDDVLALHAGEFGRWQLRHFVLTSMAWSLEAFHTMIMIFADREPSWSCSSASCATTGDICKMEPSAWAWDGGAAASTVAEWGLVCGEKYKVGLVQAVFFVGCMLGAGLFGHLSDSSLGRKGSLVIICILNFTFGILTSLSSSYWAYAALRFLTGCSTGGVGLCAFVLATEPVGPTKRGVAGMSTFYFFSGGIAILSGIAYIFPSWRDLYVVTSIPSLLFLVAVLPFVSESPRWYLVRGKVKEATEVVKMIAVTNGRELPDGLCLVLDDDESSREGDSAADHPPAVLSGANIVDVVRTPLTRLRLFLAVAICFLCAVVYYGLSLNVVNLKTNLYLSVLLNAVAEMPAFVLTATLLDTFGRKPLAVATMWLSGASCLAGSFFPAAGTARSVRVGCGVLGIFGMAANYNLLFIYVAELFPTVVRNAALGCTTQAGQLGAILAPLVVVLGEKVPFAVFGVCGIAGGLLAFYLPETKNQPLYDTIGGMEGGEKKRRLAYQPAA